MAAVQTSGIHRYLRKVVLRQDGGMTDGQLLKCFLSQRDEAAFAALMRRHGPMVFGVCRRVLRNAHDAEDAFQATFLVLVRKASSIGRRELLGNWLYGVAYRTAMAARGAAAKRRAKEREMAKPEAVEEGGWHELASLLDRELVQLPEKYRVPIVLCDLEGKTRKEAARQLGWPEGTINSRLARGRVILAKRLSRQGVALSGGAMTAVLAQQAASACMPVGLQASTLKAATVVAAGSATATGMVSAKVAALTEGVLKAMLLSKLKLVGVTLTIAVLACFGIGSAIQMYAGEQGPAAKSPAAGATDEMKEGAPQKQEKEGFTAWGKAGEGKGGDAAQDSGADKLYRAMEKKVRAAKSLQVALDGEVDSQAIKGTVKATIYATQGNKSRMEIDFDIGGKADKQLFLTDGKARYTKQGDKGTLHPNPKKAEQEGKLVLGTIARIGFTGAMMMAHAKAGEEKEVDLDKDAPVTNFKLGAKEMVGNKTAQVVTYKLDFDGTSAKMSVWIDTKTNLPLKRVVAVDQDGQMFRITETYSTFAIDPKLDPKLFEVPLKPDENGVLKPDKNGVLKLDKDVPPPEDGRKKPAVEHDFTNLQRLATALENYNYPEDTADKITVWCQGGGKGTSVLVKDAKTLDVTTACHYIVDGHHDKEGLDLENVAVMSADGQSIRFVNIKEKFAAEKPFGLLVNRGELVIVLQLRKD